MSAVLVWILGGWWGIAFCVHLSSLLIEGKRPAPMERGAARPGVSVLIPVKGVDADFADNLRAFFRQSYPRFELIFAVADVHDPAVSMIEAAIAAHPAVPARLLVGEEEQIAGNPKITNLVKAERAAQYDLLLLSAANMAPAPDTIERLVPCLAPGVGYVSAITMAVRPRNFVAELECICNNGFGFRWLHLGWRFGLQAALGAASLLRRADLHRGGGMASLATRGVCDDGELMRMMHAQGKRAILALEPVPNPVGVRRFRQFWNRHQRWLYCRSHYNPETLPVECLVLNTVLPTIAGALFWSSISPARPLLCGALVAGGFFLMETFYFVRRGWPLSWRLPALWLIRELLLPLLWLDGLSRRRLDWRGTVISLPSARGRG